MDVTRGEIVEAALDPLLTERHDRCVADEGERPVKKAWFASERRSEDRRPRNRWSRAAQWEGGVGS